MDRSELPKGVFRPLFRVSAGLLGWSRPHDTLAVLPTCSQTVPEAFPFSFRRVARPPSVFPFCSF